MGEQYIPPSKQDRSAGRQAGEQSSISMWTLSYRLKGMTMGLALAALYSYFYLHSWPKELLIGAGVLGYFLGWVAGRFSYTKKVN